MYLPNPVVSMSKTTRVELDRLWLWFLTDSWYFIYIDSLIYDVVAELATHGWYVMPSLTSFDLELC